MKRVYFSLFLFLFSSFLFCSQPGAESDVQAVPEAFPVVEVFSSGVNLEKDELIWLPNAAGEKLESNLSRFTDFNIINSSNKRQIIKIQKESETGLYDEKSVIEVGRLTSANYGIFLNIKKVNNKYISSINYTNLANGEIVSSIISEPVSSIEELFISNGCSINKLTIDLCDSLNFPLTASEKHVLLNGEKDLPDSNRNDILMENIEKYSQQINYLDKEITILSSIPSYEAGLKQNDLEVRRALTEEKLLNAQTHNDRILAEIEKKHNDEVLDIKRSEEQKLKINKMSLFLKDKIAHIGYVNDISFLDRINIIEAIKQTYVELSQEIESEKERILNEAASEISFKIQEIESRPLTKNQVDGWGKITDDAFSGRNREISKIKNNIEKQALKDIKKFSSNMEKEQNNLLNSIEKGYKEIKSGTINSLGNNLVIEFDNYDGERLGWTVFVSVESDDRIIYRTSVFISYADLTGKNPVTKYDSFGYENYVNTVDFYTSLFLRGEPYLTFSLDYSVVPLDKRFPSQYKFEFSNLQVFETKNISLYGNNIIAIPLSVFELDNNSCEIQMYPSHDLRSTEDLQLEARHFEEQLWGKN